MAEKEKLTEILSIRLSKTAFDDVCRAAKARGVEVQEFARRALVALPPPTQWEIDAERAASIIKK